MPRDAAAKIGSHGRLVENIVSMFIMQGANYALPLLSIPYLIHTLGAANYGRIAFAQAFTLYFSVAVDYGFGLSATRQVALLRGEPHALSKFISSVFFIQLSFAISGFALMAIITIFVPPFVTDRPIYYLAYLAVAGNILCPSWLFRGLQLLKMLTRITIAARSLMILMLFVCVHHPRDLFIAAGIQSTTMIIAAVPAFIAIRAAITVRPNRPNWSDIKNVLKEGWHAFISTAAISLYTSTNTFVLGLIASPEAVGYYAVANKLIQAVTNLITPVSTSVYPHIVSLFANSRAQALRFIHNLFWLQGSATCCLSIAIFFLSAPIIHFLFGQDMAPAIIALQIMSPLPLLIGLSNIFGIQTMMVFDMKRVFSRILVTSGLLNLIIILPLVHYGSTTGTAIALVSVEAYVTAAMAMRLRKDGILQPITAIPNLSFGR